MFVTSRGIGAAMKAFNGSRRMVLLVGAAAALVAAVAVIYAVLSPVEVSGDTPAERIASIHEITVRRPRGAGNALARAAADDPSPAVRAEALAALSQFLEPEHRSVVEKGTTDSDVRVRIIAVEVLGVFDDKAAAEALAEVVARGPDEDERVIHAALRGLVSCHDPIAVVTLFEIASEGNSREVKLVAMKSLLRKYNGTPPKGADPKNQAVWRDLAQRWRRSFPIKDAYAAAGVELIDRPQDIIGHDYHPERREEPERREKE